MYGVVSMHAYRCSSCHNCSELAIKITSNETQSDITRNSHEVDMWKLLSNIPGVVPLLSTHAIGQYFCFVMPKMKPLSSLMTTTSTLAFKIRVIKRLTFIFAELTKKGLVYPDGGCKQLLLDANTVYLCDFGAVMKGDISETMESLRLVIWELRVMFKGNAEKLKRLEDACTSPTATFACIEREISILTGDY